jgi:hypothetical protein
MMLLHFYNSVIYILLLTYLYWSLVKTVITYYFHTARCYVNINVNHFLFYKEMWVFLLHRVRE